MFCSATPALMNRGPSARRSGSSAMKPRSPVRKTNGSSLARSTIASEKAFLISADCSWPGELGDRRRILRIAQGKVVPFQAVLHEGHAFAFDRVQENHRAGMSGCR